VVIEWWRKRRALRRIARRLPRELVLRYGASDAYSAEQVRSVLQAGRYPRRYWDYAFAMCLLADAAAAHLGGAGQVQALRGEIADRFFHGDGDFSMDAAREQSFGAGHDHAGLPGGGFHDAGGGGFGDGGAGGGP
jgi:hypothetical protein